MKKILVLCTFFVGLSSVGFCNVTPNDILNIDNLRKQGFSESTLQVTDDMHYKQEIPDGTYTRYYTKKEPTTKAGKAYDTIKQYFYPAYDDGMFGDHDINFTDTWSGQETNWSTRYVPKSGVNNL